MKVIEDELYEDPVISHQQYCCLSFVSPNGRQKGKVNALKVRGSFSKKEEADAHAKKLRQLDSEFDIFVAEVGKWLPWYPDPTEIDMEYAEEELNSLIKGHKEELYKSEAFYNERKKDLKKQAMALGTKEGQELLANQKPHPVALRHKIAEIEKDIAEMEDELKKSKELLDSYTEEEIKNLEEDPEYYTKNIAEQVNSMKINESLMEGENIQINK